MVNRSSRRTVHSAPAVGRPGRPLESVDPYVLANFPVTAYLQAGLLDERAVIDVIINAFADLPEDVWRHIVAVASGLCGNDTLGRRIALQAMTEIVLVALDRVEPLSVDRLPSALFMHRVFELAEKHRALRSSYDAWPGVYQFAKSVTLDNSLNNAYDALNALRSKKSRLVLYLHILCDMKSPEIAKVLGRNRPTVRKQLSRGRRELQSLRSSVRVARARDWAEIEMRWLEESRGKSVELLFGLPGWLVWDEIPFPWRECWDAAFFRIAGLTKRSQFPESLKIREVRKRVLFEALQAYHDEHPLDLNDEGRVAARLFSNVLIGAIVGNLLAIQRDQS